MTIWCIIFLLLTATEAVQNQSVFDGERDDEDITVNSDQNLYLTLQINIQPERFRKSNKSTCVCREEELVNDTCVSSGRCVYPIGTYPRDCEDVYQLGGLSDGVYWIQPEGTASPVQVKCEMSNTTKWNVLMSRYNGLLSFYQPWDTYKSGFGEVDKEHWLGLETIHFLTNQGPYKVRFEMREWESQAKKWSEFTTFSIGPESSNYNLTIDGESGTATKMRMTKHLGWGFSTRDQDHDTDSGNCARFYFSGWWFGSCYKVMLTGPYGVPCADYKCMCWDYFVPLDRVTVKVARL